MFDFRCLPISKSFSVPCCWWVVVICFRVRKSRKRIATSSPRFLLTRSLTTTSSTATNALSLRPETTLTQTSGSRWRRWSKGCTSSIARSGRWRRRETMSWQRTRNFRNNLIRPTALPLPEIWDWMRSGNLATNYSINKLLLIGQ